MTTKLAAIERLKILHGLIHCNGRYVVAAVAPSFLTGSSSFIIEFGVGQIPPLTSELSALESLKNQGIILWPL